MKNKLLFLMLSVAYCLSAQENLWLRYPSISPDGKTIVFCHQGDIYKVPTSGGKAEILTTHDAIDYMPVWSQDGSQIAFASDRYGNFDVFTMPATGGEAQRLTFHSNHDLPYSFSADNKSVIFGSQRLDINTNIQFPARILTELYSVPTKGGEAKQILSIAAEDVKVSKSGVLYFHDRKGYEDPWRKHQTSIVARDIWSYNPSNKLFAQLTDFEGEDRSPVLSADESKMYYLSERDGNFNVWEKNFKTNHTQVTSFKDHPVRFLSISKQNTLCFGWDGKIYTLSDKGDPTQVQIQIQKDDRYNPEKILPITDGLSELSLSKNGKEVVYVVRGEVFVSSVEGAFTKRITNTPEQERNVSFSPDGKSILYASERNGSWKIYKTSLDRKEEKNFFNSTVLKEELIYSVAGKEVFQPSYSPDGKEVAFLEERTTLKVINLESRQIRTILGADKNYSYSDGDQYYQWSPDSKWFIVNYLPKDIWIEEVGLISADGTGEIKNLSQNGYDDYSPKWQMDGKMLIWFSNKDGMKNHASWGSQADVYGLFLNQEWFDKFKLSKDEYNLIKDEKKDSSKKDQEFKLNFDWNNLDAKKIRLTVHSSDLSDAVMSKDGDKLYYICKFEEKYNIWVHNFREDETKIFSKINASSAGNLMLTTDGKNLILLSDGKILKVDTDKGESKTVSVASEMTLNTELERQYLFEHAWRQVVKKFYKTDLHNVKWDFYKKEYSKFLPSINNNFDFAEMLSELLGELNASHTGCRYTKSQPNSDATASLGVFYDEEYGDKGLKIKEIMFNNSIFKAQSKVKPGAVITHIDGIEIDHSFDYNKLLNRKAGKNVLLKLLTETGTEAEEVVKPITLGEESELLYQRYIENCNKIVEKASEGQVGYVHVRGMNDGSFRKVYEQALGRHGEKKALIVDTRFNGGGWLHDDLCTFLSGVRYVDFIPREQKIGFDPQRKWTKPNCVLVSESNYSDAHFFPYVYKYLKIGKLIGTQVAGTATAVWWEKQQDPTLVFGIPQVGVVGMDGKYLENQNLDPDIKVTNNYNKAQTGEDQQLEEAVKQMLLEIKNKKN